ncbi:MAG: hypothetical protein IJU43_03860 [Lachnospiraceae bacterium]|nr:hypothetical protein [Lachnospiraceae bacterium]
MFIFRRNLVTDDGTGHMSYVEDINAGRHLKEEIISDLGLYEAEHTPLNELADKYGTYVYDWDYTPGMYFQLGKDIPMDPVELEILDSWDDDDDHVECGTEYEVHQILTKEDMGKLPEGATLDDDIMHY